MPLVHISFNTDGRVSVFLQEGVIKEFLYLDRGWQSRKEKKGERRKKGQEEGRKEGKVSISLYLPGENVERTKQMNRREEGMITTKMIIFNKNHDNILRISIIIIIRIIIIIILQNKSHILYIFSHFFLH